MPHMLFSEVSTSSLFRQPWGIRRVRRLGITWLLTLGTAALCILVSAMR
jgi:hypothetical protein